jgi:hypothetical protein
MNSEYKDFIGVFSGVYPEGFCEHLISEFDRNQTLGVGSNRLVSENAAKHRKDDYQICANGKNINFESFNGDAAVDVFFDGLQRCFQQYSEEYSVLKDVDTRSNNMKMQKTSSGGGYHVWHAEQGNGDQARRSLVYSLYLNTLPQEACGETEFIYQQRKLAPVENTMVLWPAGYTHPHRGNPVYGDNTKYIITGWFYNE